LDRGVETVCDNIKIVVEQIRGTYPIRVPVLGRMSFSSK